MSDFSVHQANAVRPDPARIVVPRKHGQVLVEPGYGVLVEAMREGGKRNEMRKAAREHFLEAAKKWARAIGVEGPDAQMLEKKWVITGHQVEFYHAGVWAKVIAADEVTRRVEGVAFDLLVDHDVVDHLGVDVPAYESEKWRRVMVAWDEATALSADSIETPNVKQFEAWDAKIASHPLTRTDSMAMVLASLRDGVRGENYVRWMSGARRKFERAMGLTVHHVPTSLMCEMPEWWMFVWQWAINADQWTRIYNEELGAYRKRQGIKNDHHPMPDLVRKEGDGDVFELPFWIYRRGEARQRLMLRKDGEKVFMLHDGVAYEFNSLFTLHHSDLLVRPRALTLTMFVRLFLADLFVHGIGGALYDQITDGLLAKLFGQQLPYACVSAAWLLPLGEGGQPLENGGEINQLLSQRHHLLHNPQLAIDPSTAEVAQRQALIRKIAESLATARRGKKAFEQRRQRFEQLHAMNEALHAKAPDILRKLDVQIAECRRARERNKVLLWREYFFGLHTMASLRQLIEKMRGGEERSQ
ncbi:MAG: hypothetical protein FWD61_12185 [Phycisphaerales bacterium]|nr:hypothetical protein [Phycisphaerales bacterium]